MFGTNERSFIVSFIVFKFIVNCLIEGMIDKPLKLKSIYSKIRVRFSNFGDIQELIIFNVSSLINITVISDKNGKCKASTKNCRSLTTSISCSVTFFAHLMCIDCRLLKLRIFSWNNSS